MFRTPGSAIIRYFAPKSLFFMLLGACRLKRFVLLSALALACILTLASCGASGTPASQPSNALATRVLASQSVGSPTTAPGLIVIDGTNDTLARVREISAGFSPGLMTLSPNRSTLLSFDGASNNVDVVSAQAQTTEG